MVLELFVLSMLLAFITILPEIYSASKSKDFWMPINALPIMVGDDYHYFSILNRLHSRVFSRDKHCQLVGTSSNANRSQMLPQLINLIPFALGSSILDARFGILLVRFSNRASFFLSSALLSESVCSIYLGLNIPDWVHSLQGLLLYLAFPGPITLHFRKSLIRNLKNQFFVFEKNRTSDINRAYVLETVLPILIASVAWIIINVDNTPKFFIIFSVVLLVNILAYPPVGVAFLSQSIAIFLYNGYPKTQIIAFLILGTILLLAVQRYIQGDSYGKETYVESKLVKYGFFISKWACAEILVISAFFVGTFIFLGDVAFLALGVGVLSLFNLTTHHNLSRIWYRGGAPLFQLYSTIIVISVIYSSSSSLVFLLYALAIVFLIYFYTRQAKILLKVSYFFIPDEYQHLTEIIFNNTKESRDITVLSNDSEFLKLLAIYSKVCAVGSHHGLNNNDFIRQLELAAATYKLLDLEIEQFQRDHTCFFNYFDFLDQRSSSFNLPKKYQVFSHSRQMFDTYYLFSEFLSLNGYYRNGKFTDKFVAKLSYIWNSASVTDIVQFLLNNENNLVKVLRCDDESRNSFSIRCNTNFK